MSGLTWKTERRRIGDLVPLESNPFGKMDARKRRRLEEKLLSLGVFEAPTVDTFGVLLTFNKRHHILMGLGRADETIDVMVPDRPLTETERKQIILSSNVHEGEWVADILREQYADIDLAEMGVSFGELDKMLEESGKEAKSAEKPVYPIVAEFSERHEAFIIVCANEIDANFISGALQMGRMQSYKSEAVGHTHIITAKDFIALWNSKQSL